MGRADYYEEGDWNATCSMCGRKRKGTTLVRNWQGQWRCPEHNEPRHPQDFVRGVPETETVPFVQNPADTFVSVCMPNGQSAIPGAAIPGCMVPGYISPAHSIWDR